MRINVRAEGEKRHRRDTDLDATVAHLRSLSPEELDTYITENSTNLPQIRILLQALVKMVVHSALGNQ